MHIQLLTNQNRIPHRVPCFVPAHSTATPGAAPGRRVGRACPSPCSPGICGHRWWCSGPGRWRLVLSRLAGRRLLNEGSGHGQYIQPFILHFVMKNIPAFLLCVIFLSLCLVAQAQTMPALQPKIHSVKPLPRIKGTVVRKGKAYGAPFIKDTAAFRRSGRPADIVPIPPRQKE